MSLLERLRAGLKQITDLRFPGTRSWWAWPTLGNTRYDYQANAQPRSNSIVESCVAWIQRTFPEAPFCVYQKTAQGEVERVDDHPLKQLIDTPNDFYPGELLWAATLADRTVSGNAYWLKVR